MQTLASLLMLTIRLYTSGDLAAADIAAAQRSADAIFQQALIDVEWTDCRKGPKKPRPLTCEAPPGDFEIVLRLTGTTSGGSQPGGDALGDAVLDTTTGRGALGTVYVNRVKSLARASRTPEGELLGRVIAHEVGHLLLGRAGHPESGVMRGDWPRRVLADRRDRDWTFSAEESLTLRSRLGGGDHQPTGTPVSWVSSQVFSGAK